MNGVQSEMVLEVGLTAEESARFERVRNQVSEVFAEAGLSLRVCRAMGDGPDRRIGFYAGMRVLLMTGEEFMRDEDEVLVGGVRGAIG